MKLQQFAKIVSAILVIALSACGGGSDSMNTGGAVSGANAGAMSTGSITAFGSVFVNGHEFSTMHARVIDDDSGNVASASALEVGMVVDVTSAAGSSSAVPIASELHVHPLARGYVDTSDVSAGLLTVMGQTIAVTSSTNFSDHRVCVSASLSPCAAITGQSDLTATIGSGATAVPGSYVTVHGYLFASGSSATNIVATLVSLADAPTSPTPGTPSFKAEGVVTLVSGTTITIGALNVDLSSANCFAAGTKTNCAGAFNVGQVVSAMAAAAPILPAASFAADAARLRSKLVVTTVGTPVEIEGSVSSVTPSPAGFVVRGVSVDASALPAGSSLPAVGDIVKVLGTVSATGESVTATSVIVMHASRSAAVGLQGDVSDVTSPATNTYIVSILGQNVTVNSATRLADRSTKQWILHDPQTNPFNIATFQTYLAASPSQHLIVRAEADVSGNLTASSLTIVPASTTAGVAGVVDALPAPMNSSSSGTPSTFSVHGVAVAADPAAVLRPNRSPATVAAGDEVVAYGSWTAGALTVTAGPTRSNVVVDFGPQSHHHLGGF